MASTKKDTHITNLAALEKAANGEIVALPGWTEEQPFVARLKRASLTGMIRAGKIPNPLIAAAQKLYEGSGKSRATAKLDLGAYLKKAGVTRDALASRAGVSPTTITTACRKEPIMEAKADQISAALGRKKKTCSASNRTGRRFQQRPLRNITGLFTPSCSRQRTNS